MKNKGQAHAWVYTLTGLSHLFCIFWAFIALTPSASEQSSFAAAGGFGVIVALALIASQIPVFALIYIGAGLVLRRISRQKKPITGNILLFLSLVTDILFYLGWSEHAENDTGPLLIFLPPALIVIGIWVFLSVPAFLSKEKSPGK